MGIKELAKQNYNIRTATWLPHLHLAFNPHAERRIYDKYDVMGDYDPDLWNNIHDKEWNAYHSDLPHVNVCIICIPLPKRITDEFIGTITHELVHYYYACIRRMCDESPSEEFNAYLIQHALVDILEATRSEIKNVRESK